MTYNGQLLQDKFVLNVLQEKKNGYFLEIGSNHPEEINNSYLLEKEYSWKGIMVEYDSRWLDLYKKNRPNSIHIINDARKVNYKNILEENNYPNNLDYLQLDIEANNGSTLETLIKLDKEILDTYTFAVVTFEHDIYHTNYMNTRDESRKIFEKRNYIRVFGDVCCAITGRPFEDWYIHPALVNSNLVSNLINKNKQNYKNIWGDWINGELYNRKSPSQGELPVINETISYKDIIY